MRFAYLPLLCLVIVVRENSLTQARVAQAESNTAVAQAAIDCQLPTNADNPACTGRTSEVTSRPRGRGGKRNGGLRGKGKVDGKEGKARNRISCRQFTSRTERRRCKKLKRQGKLDKLRLRLENERRRNGGKTKGKLSGNRNRNENRGRRRNGKEKSARRPAATRRPPVPSL